jgi:hypothetical protein
MAEEKKEQSRNPQVESGVCVNFFDDADLTPIQPKEDPGLEIRHVGSNWKRMKFGAKTEKGLRYFHLPPEVVRAKRDMGSTPLVAELRLSKEHEVGCTRYTTSIVSFLVKDEEELECCCIPFPLHRLAETCSIKFCAYDASETDFIENAKIFRNNVEWAVTAVPTPVAAIEAAAKSAGAPQASTPKFQPWISSVRSVEGAAEIFDVPLHQLFQIETRAPEGYICEGSALEYRYICCERSIEIKNYFRPCGKRPARSAIFVQQKCHGIRWGNTKVLVGGREVEISEDGIMKVPEDMNGVFPISLPGKAFSPSSLDLREGANPVSTVAVSDQPVTGRSVRGRFVDDADSPFVRRPLTVLLPNGDEVQVLTDDEGYFEAPHGSRVYAREDEWGSATGPVYLIESI